LKLYRIAKTSRIHDLSGEGARLYGGRWNDKGVPAIYASESRSLAALEYLVHLPIALAPKDLSICRFKVPDDSVTHIRKKALPRGWKDYPAGEKTKEFGSRWASRGKTLLLAVPSVLVPDEYNYPINPQHEDFTKIRKRVEKFRFDPRLAQK